VGDNASISGSRESSNAYASSEQSSSYSEFDYGNELHGDEASTRYMNEQVTTASFDAYDLNASLDSCQVNTWNASLHDSCIDSVLHCEEIKTTVTEQNIFLNNPRAKKAR
jgi:hypothetical protein